MFDKLNGIGPMYAAAVASTVKVLCNWEGSHVSHLYGVWGAEIYNDKLWILSQPVSMLTIPGKVKQLLTVPRVRLLQWMVPCEKKTYLLHT